MKPYRGDPHFDRGPLLVDQMKVLRGPQPLSSRTWRHWLTFLVLPVAWLFAWAVNRFD